MRTDAFIGFAAQAKPARFDSAGALALYRPSPLVLTRVTQRRRNKLEFDRQRCGAYAPLIGCDQSTGKPRPTDPVTSFLVIEGDKGITYSKCNRM